MGRKEGRELPASACWEWVGVDSLNPTDAVLPSQILPTETDVTLTPSLNRAPCLFVKSMYVYNLCQPINPFFSVDAIAVHAI